MTERRGAMAMLAAATVAACGEAAEEADVEVLGAV